MRASVLCKKSDRLQVQREAAGDLRPCAWLRHDRPRGLNRALDCAVGASGNVLFQLFRGLFPPPPASSSLKAVARNPFSGYNAGRREPFGVGHGAMEDYYKLLGVEPSASAKEIGKAFRQLARKVHPDKLPPDSSEEVQLRAKQRFQQAQTHLLSEAVGLLF